MCILILVLRSPYLICEEARLHKRDGDSQYEANAGCVGQGGAVGTRKEYVDWNACDVRIVCISLCFLLESE